MDDQTQTWTIKVRTKPHDKEGGIQYYLMLPKDLQTMVLHHPSVLYDLQPYARNVHYKQAIGEILFYLPKGKQPDQVYILLAKYFRKISQTDQLLNFEDANGGQKGK